MTTIICIIVCIVLGVITYDLHRLFAIHTNIKFAILKTELLKLIELDVARVWKSFFESYLFVYANSKMVPNEKEFLELRSSYVKMFQLMIGRQQCQMFSEVFFGEEQFTIYLWHSFERHFKNVFVEILIDKNMLKNNKDDSK